MSDSPEFFELDSEEEDDIVARRVRRARKARRTARESEGVSPETDAQVAEASGRDTLAVSSDEIDSTTGTDPATAPDPEADAVFELDPEDDDIFAGRRQRGAGRAKAAPEHTGRWFVVAILVGVVAGVVLGAMWLSNKDKNPSMDAMMTAGADATMDPAQVQSDISDLETQLAADPTDYDAHVDLGNLLHISGDSDGAFLHWSTATDLAPDRPEAWYSLGMFYYPYLSPPDIVAARQALTKVVELAPDGSDIKQTAQDHLDRLSGS